MLVRRSYTIIKNYLSVLTSLINAGCDDQLNLIWSASLEASEHNVWTVNITRGHVVSEDHGRFISVF